jgi:hypothetical protein
MPVSRQAGIQVQEMNAALALLSMGGMHGEMAGTAYREMIAKLTTDNKLEPFVKKTKQGGLDLAATMQTLASSLGGLSPLEQTRALKGLGFNLRDVEGVEILINCVKELRAVEGDLNNSHGEAARLAGVRMSAADEQWANLQNNIDLLRASIGENLLPAVNRLIPRLAAGLQSLKGWADKHKDFVKFAAEAAAWGAAILIPLGALALLGASLSFIGSYVPIVLKFLNPFKLWAAATKVVTGAQWLLNAAMDANPIVLTIAAVAALGVAAYEVYEHWAAVKNFFKEWGMTVLSFIVAPFAMLPYEIMKHWGAIKDAAKAVAHGIASFFVGHSPIPEGPLHDLNLSREIARTIEPGPMLTAIRRVAMVTAIAAPMMVGAGASTAIAARAGAGGATVQITYAPVIHIGAGADAKGFRLELERHARNLVDIVNREMAKRSRREF